MPANILVIDSAQIGGINIKPGLERAGFHILSARGVDDARRLLAVVRFDLILFGVSRSCESEELFVEALRDDAYTTNTPLIVLGAPAAKMRRIKAEISGFFHVLSRIPARDELIRLVKVVLRQQRHPRTSDRAVTVAGLSLDPATQRAYSDRRGSRLALPLSDKELRLLYFMMTHADRVYSRSDLVEQAWDGSVLLEAGTVDKCVERLRRKLRAGLCENMIEAVYGFGYKFSSTK
jgi:two-component system phosphate regulon response regulator PhoB